MNHHPLSMSNWPKWEQCPCAMSGGPESTEAQSGTRSHAYLAYRALQTLGIDAPAPEGVTADERNRAEWALAEATAIFGSYRFDVEQKVTIHGHDELDGISGTADLCAALPDRILVIDYKTYSVNSTDMTAQPEGYALAIASTLPFPPEAVEVVILHGGSREVERKQTTLTACIERAHRIITSHLDHADDIKLAAPNHFCRYCGRLNSCPGADKAVATVQDESRFMSLPLAAQLVVAKQVKSICERVEASVKAELDRQIADGAAVEEAIVEGAGVAWRYKLKPGKEKLADIVSLANEVSEHGIDSAGLMALAEISKTKLCEALHQRGNMTTASAKRLIKPFYTAGTPQKWLERVA